MKPHSLSVSFGDMLRDCRTKNGWTLNQVRVELEQNHGITVSCTAVWNWEKNSSVPKMRTMSALLTVFNMSPTEKLVAYELAGQAL